MIGVRSSSDFRAGLQNGFWGLKYIVIIGGMIGAFFIPEEGNFGEPNVVEKPNLVFFSKETFLTCPSLFEGTVWMYFGMIGGFLFILIQLVLIIDFAHSWAESWVG